MRRYDVTTVVRIRVRSRSAEAAESLVLNLFDTHLGQMLDCPAVVETGVELSPNNPTSTPAPARRKRGRAAP